MRIATHSRFGSPRLASAILGTARRIHRFVYDCVIAERVSMLQFLYGVNTPHYVRHMALLSPAGFDLKMLGELGL
jgi:hypothetical protein